MKNIMYTIVIGMVTFLSYFVVAKTISQQLIIVTAIVVGIHLVGLFIIQFALPQHHGSITAFQTLFTALLIIPITLTSAVVMQEGEMADVWHFLIGIAIMYILLLLGSIVGTLYTLKTARF